MVVGIEHLFAGEGLLDMKWARALRNAISMREEADYGSMFSVEGAKTTVSNAEGLFKRSEGET